MKRNEIKQIKAKEILDSRGIPTIKVFLKTNLDIISSFSVPSGTSEGKYEAQELRDGDKRYFGKGVKKAVKNVNEILSKKLKGEDITFQERIDQLLIELDGTEKKKRLGANAILGVSVAVLKAGAKAKNLPLFEYIANTARIKIKKRNFKLPDPSFKLIGGGAHAGTDLQVQEFMIIPKAPRFEQKVKIASEIYQTLKSILEKKYGKIATNVGYEGGFAPPIKKTEKALDLIILAAKERGYLSKIKIALDIAASAFFENNSYKFEDRIFTGSGLLKFYMDLSKNYPLFLIEDPFFEEDWGNFKMLAKTFKNKVIVFGDDLLATNLKRIKRARELNACSGLVLKPDQIGTFSEAILAAKEAKKAGWKIMVSHRSGDTCDTFISDLAMGIGADFVKFGAPSRGERVVKYNRLLEIEEFANF